MSYNGYVPHAPSWKQCLINATLAIAWTGLTATDLNFLLETTALSTVSSSEAAVILATEPLWVTLFTYLFLHESFNADDCVGGILIIAACVVIAWKSESPEDRAQETETLCEPLVNDCSGGAETDMDASNETESLVGSGYKDLS
jgi:small-conductance mechanosensitive channel